MDRCELQDGKSQPFRSEYGCYLIIKFLLEGIFQDNPYFRDYKRLEHRRKQGKVQERE